MTLPEKIQKLRRGRGLSQEQLAAELGVSRQSVSKWELGTTAPELDKLRALSDYFQVSTDYLLRDEWEEGQTMARDSVDTDQAAHEQRRKALFQRLAHILLCFGIPYLVLRLAGPLISWVCNALPLRMGSTERILLVWSILCTALFFIGLLQAGLTLWRYFKNDAGPLVSPEAEPAAEAHSPLWKPVLLIALVSLFFLAQLYGGGKIGNTELIFLVSFLTGAPLLCAAIVIIILIYYYIKKHRHR